MVWTQTSNLTFFLLFSWLFKINIWTFSNEYKIPLSSFQSGLIRNILTLLQLATDSLYVKVLITSRIRTTPPPGSSCSLSLLYFCPSNLPVCSLTFLSLLFLFLSCPGSLLTRPNGRRPKQGLPPPKSREERPLVSPLAPALPPSFLPSFPPYHPSMFSF